MEANQFDNNAKNRVSKHESQMDVDAFWDQLEPKLPKDKSRPKFFMLFLIAGLLLCSGLLGWYLISKNKQQDSNVKVAEQTIAKNNAANAEKEILDPSNTIDNRNSNKESKTLQSNTNDKDKSNSIIQENNKTKSSDVKISKSEIRYSFKEKKVVNKIRIDKKEKKVENLNSDIETSKPSTVNIANGLIEKTKSDLSTNEKLANENISEVREEPVIESKKVITELKNNQEVGINNNEVEEEKKLDIKEQPVELNQNSIPTIEEVQPIIIPKKENFGLQFIPIMGIGFCNKKLSGSGNDTISNYVKLRNELESSLEEWLLGLNFKISYKQFGLLTGIEYVKRNERFEFLSNKEENHFGNTAIRVETNDSFDIISGTGWYGGTLIRKVTQYNSIRQWNIPLGLSYAYKFHGVQLDISGGAMFSISNQISGKTIDSNLNIVEWNQSPDLSYNTNLGVGWFGELSCTFPIANRIAFNAGFRIQEFPGNYLNGPLDLQYRSYLLRSGLVVSLF